MINDNKKSTKMVPAICTQCGAQLEVDSEREEAFCQYCGTQFIVEKAINSYNVHNAKIEHVETMNINKRGAVESVLNFVEGQQNKKQQKIDEEKRLKEEMRRREEEKSSRRNEKIIMIFGAIVHFLLDKKNWKRNYSILGAVVIVIIILSLIGVSRDKPDHTGEAKTPSGSSAQKGRDYKDVIDNFEEKGFTNIQTEVLDDLITGWLTKDGEVESVSVDGNEDYSPDDWYPNDVEVIITYHTFPEKDSNVVVEEKSIEPTAEPSTTETLEETEDYTEINGLLFEDLLQAQGWALGLLDRDGKPTENGTHSQSFAFSLYIKSITYLGDKLRISVLPEFEQLSDEDKTFITNTVQNMVNVYTNHIPYTTILLDGNAIGNSKVTDSENFKWDKYYN